MALTEEQKDAVALYMKDKGVRGCAACGYNEFNIEGIYALPNEVRLNTQIKAIETLGMWVVVAVCGNCSHVMMFHEPELPL